MTRKQPTPDVPDLERSALEAEATRLENEVDSLPLAARQTMVERLRSSLITEGIVITDEDENVFSRFLEGTLDSRHLVDQFHSRLFSTQKSSS